LETNLKIDILLLLHFYKNIKEIQSDCLLLIYNGLYTTNVSSKCFYHYKTINERHTRSKSECFI